MTISHSKLQGNFVAFGQLTSSVNQLFSVSTFLFQKGKLFIFFFLEAKYEKKKLSKRPFKQVNYFICNNFLLSPKTNKLKSFSCRLKLWGIFKNQVKIVIKCIKHILNWFLTKNLILRRGATDFQSFKGIH